MSYKTWMDEYYPVPASEAIRSPVEAAKHSLRKWIGLRQENLTRHKVATDKDGYAPRIGALWINSHSCALCVWGNDDCTCCPLYAYREQCPCDVTKESEDISPYHGYVRTNNPEPMIRELEGTVAMLESNANQ